MCILSLSRMTYDLLCDDSALTHSLTLSFTFTLGHFLKTSFSHSAAFCLFEFKKLLSLFSLISIFFLRSWKKVILLPKYTSSHAVKTNRTLWPKVYEHLTHRLCRSYSKYLAHSWNHTIVEDIFQSIERNWSSQTFQHVNTSVHKGSFMTTWFAKDGVVESLANHDGRTWVSCSEPWPQPQWIPSTFGNPDCTPDILVQWSHHCPVSPTLLSDKWANILTAMFQNLVERFHRRVEDITRAKGRPIPY